MNSLLQLLPSVKSNDNFMKSCFVFFSIFYFTSFSAQPEIDFDTNYIQTFRENFYPYTFVNTRAYNLEIYDFDKDDYTNYYPDAAASFGLGFDYKWMTLNYSLSLISKKDRKGKNTNFGYGITRRKFRISFLYQNYKGFSQYNTRQIDTLNMIDSSSFRPNLRNWSLQTSFFYIFNHRKASYRSAFLYFEKQLKSSGSFTLGSNIFYNKIEAQNSLISWQLDTIVPEEEQFKKASNINFSINGGGFYNFVFLKNFHLAAYLALNIYTTVRTEKNDYSTSKGESNLGAGFDYRILLGFDNNKTFSGITLAGNTFAKNHISNSFGINYVILEIYFGKRFNLNFKKNNRLIDIE